MASIAYITDSNMLEMHRLNMHNTMNFWRLSNKINFKNFSAGDLVFFLSKDKDVQRNKEKGVVGYGVLDSIYLNSVNTMWKKFGKENGYNSLEGFKEALLKVSKDKTLPKKISSLYLKEISFFQSPVYLSDCGVNVSNNIESFIYLDDETTRKLLVECRDHLDMWFSLNQEVNLIDRHILINDINSAHRMIGELKVSDLKKKRALKQMKNLGYTLIQDSSLEAYKLNDEEIEIIFYHDKDIDDKALIGQAYLYRKMLNLYHLTFKTSDQNQELEKLMES